jgi:hypothetical protein
MASDADSATTHHEQDDDNDDVDLRDGPPSAPRRLLTSIALGV